MKVSTILDQIDFGSMALPGFKRSHVWDFEQVRRLTPCAGNAQFLYEISTLLENLPEICQKNRCSAWFGGNWLGSLLR